jgi:hypothetical protein
LQGVSKLYIAKAHTYEDSHQPSASMYRTALPGAGMGLQWMMAARGHKAYLSIDNVCSTLTDDNVRLRTLLNFQVAFRTFVSPVLATLIVSKFLCEQL